MPIAITGIPSKIQPTAKNGTLQTKNRKQALASQKRMPNATPDRNHAIANAKKDVSIRVVRSISAISIPARPIALKRIGLFAHLFGLSGV